MSHKTEQVASTLQRVVADVLRRGLNDPRMEGGLVGVTRVEVSPDLRHASVYVSVLPDKYQKRVLAALRHAAGYVQAEVKKKVAMRIVPRLDFRYDEQLHRQNVVLEAISEGLRRSGPAPEPQDDPQAEPEPGDGGDTPAEPR